MKFDNKKLNKKKIIILCICIAILLILAIIGTLYQKNNNVRNFLDKYIFFKEKHENNLPKISINEDSSLDVFSYKSKILVLQNNQLTIYNQNGNEEARLDIEISNPIFKANDDYLCIAERDGKKIYMLSGKNILWQKDLDDNISDFVINSNGYLAVSLSGSIYKSIIQTFDNKGTPLFKQFLSFTYVIDMDISPDNKYLAIAEANLSGILIQSNIKIISMEKALNGDTDSVIYTKLNENGELIVNLKYESKDVLACVYDNHIETIKENENFMLSDFKEEDVLFIDINDKIIKVVQEKSNTYLQIINAITNTTKNFEIDEPKELYTSNNIIALNLGSEILFYNNSGWLVKKYYATQEINKIVLCDDLAGVIYNNKIELISL